MSRKLKPMKMQANQQAKWHENPTNVILLLVFFFPLGLYYMWTHEMWTLKTRKIVTAVLVFFFVISFFDDDSDSGYEESNIEVSFEEAKSYAKEYAMQMGHALVESNIGDMGSGNEIYMFLTVDEYTGASCFLTITPFQLDIMASDCGTYHRKLGEWYDIISAQQY